LIALATALLQGIGVVEMGLKKRYAGIEKGE